MEVKLKDTERIDDLQLKGLKVIQDKNGFCFGIDAVLLANFAKVKKRCQSCRFRNRNRNYTSTYSRKK